MWIEKDCHGPPAATPSSQSLSLHFGGPNADRGGQVPSCPAGKPMNDLSLSGLPPQPMVHKSLSTSPLFGAPSSSHSCLHVGSTSPPQLQPRVPRGGDRSVLLKPAWSVPLPAPQASSTGLNPAGSLQQTLRVHPACFLSLPCLGYAAFPAAPGWVWPWLSSGQWNMSGHTSPCWAPQKSTRSSLSMPLDTGQVQASSKGT